MSDSTFDLGKVIEAIDQSSQSLQISVPVSSGPVGPTTAILLAFNPNRKFCLIQNLGSILYVRLGLGAGTVLGTYSFTMAPNAIISIDHWGGAITAIRESTTDNVIVTEVS